VSEVVEEDTRRLVVNGRATTQEVIRAKAEQTLATWPGVGDHAADSADIILALLDLLEAHQRLVVYLTAEADDEE